MLVRFFTLVVAAAISSSVSAGVIVDIRNATVSAGGNGFVDVLISSTGTDDLVNFQVELQLSAPTVNGALQFTAVQSDSETTAQSPLDYDYVFLGDSINFFAVRQDPDEQRLFAGDSASANRQISNTQLLLARLELEHFGLSPLAVGETFSVSLLPAGTYFEDELGALTLDSFNSGTITITPAAVPEPTSVTVLLAGSAVGLWWKRRKRRQTENTDAG